MKIAVRESHHTDPALQTGPDSAAAGPAVALQTGPDSILTGPAQYAATAEGETDLAPLVS